MNPGRESPPPPQPQPAHVQTQPGKNGGHQTPPPFFRALDHPLPPQQTIEVLSRGDQSDDPDFIARSQHEGTFFEIWEPLGYVGTTDSELRDGGSDLCSGSQISSGSDE